MADTPAAPLVAGAATPQTTAFVRMAASITAEEKVKRGNWSIFFLKWQKKEIEWRENRTTGWQMKDENEREGRVKIK